MCMNVGAIEAKGEPGSGGQLGRSTGGNLFRLSLKWRLTEIKLIGH